VLQKTKPRLFDNIVADQDLQLAGLKYFFGRECSMHELPNISKPLFEDILRQQRKQAVDAINKTREDILGKYDKALTERTKHITAATAGAFLKALKFQDDSDPNNVRGLNHLQQEYWYGTTCPAQAESLVQRRHQALLPLPPCA